MINLVASFIVVIALSSGVCAIPIPPSGHFAFPGGPDLATGVWDAIAESTDPTIVMAVASAGGQLSQRQPSTGDEVVTTLINYISYQCVNENTFVATTSGISYPTLAPISQCSIYFINETHRAVNSLPLSGGLCPNAAFAGFNLGPNGAYTSSNIYKYVDGVLPKPSSFICKNGTIPLDSSSTPSPTFPNNLATFQNNANITTSSTATAASAATPLIPPPPPSPPSTFPTLPKLGGAATPLGIWKGTDVAEIITRDGFYASYYNRTSNTLIARRSRYLNHRCLDSDVYQSNAQQFSVNLNGSTSDTMFSCETGIRKNSGMQTSLDIEVAFAGTECPPIEAVETSEATANWVPFKFEIVEPLKGNPETTCGAAPSSAAGNFKNNFMAITTGLSAGLAVLLTA